jgi:cell division septum initiation protein DivIVA
MLRSLVSSCRRSSQHITARARTREQHLCGADEQPADHNLPAIKIQALARGNQMRRKLEERKLARQADGNCKADADVEACGDIFGVP